MSARSCCLGMLLWTATTAAWADSASPQTAPLGQGYAGTGVNVAIFRQASLVTFGDTQYAAFYDGQARMVLAKRPLGSPQWQTRPTRYSGNVRDVHNVISLGIDGKGILHVSWDHHNNPLNYCRSVEPGSLELTDRLPMTGAERAVCYPQFYGLPNGDLLFLYRTGGSGAGDLMMNRYDCRTQRWTALANPIIAGQRERNAYWQAAIDPRTGAIHVSWCWRERKGNADLKTNHDVCYARSDDGGQTWLRSDGTRYALPITLDNAEVAWPVPQQSNLANMTSMAVDGRGRPYIVNNWRPAGEPTDQVHLVFRDGSRWQLRRVGGRQGYPLDLAKPNGFTLSRPLVVIDRQGRVIVILRDAARGSRISAAISQGADCRTWRLVELTSQSVGDWEPTHDAAVWQRDNVLHLFVQKCLIGYPRPSPQTAPEPVFVLQWRPPEP